MLDKVMVNLSRFMVERTHHSDGPEARTFAQPSTHGTGTPGFLQTGMCSSDRTAVLKDSFWWICALMVLKALQHPATNHVTKFFDEANAESICSTDEHLQSTLNTPPGSLGVMS